MRVRAWLRWSVWSPHVVELGGDDGEVARDGVVHGETRLGARQRLRLLDLLARHDRRRTRASRRRHTRDRRLAGDALAGRSERARA